MIFRIAHGGHLGNWRSYWNDLNTQMVCVSLNLLSLCWNTSHIIPNNHFNPLLPFWGKIVLHVCPWRPSWKLAAILKRSKLSNSSYNINCTFYMLKTHIVLSKWSFSGICCNFLAKKEDFRIAHGDHLEKWPYWNFAWPALFSCRVITVEYMYQICCLYHNLKDSSKICNYLLHY